MSTPVPLGSIAPQSQKGYLPSGSLAADLTRDLTRVVSNVLGIFTIIAGVAFLFYFMFGAINWITSGGDANKVKTAHAMIINAFIGLTITVIAYPLIQILSQLLGVPLTKPQELINQLVFQ